MALFLLVFALVYAGVCYLIPGWRIEFASEGDALACFFESIQTGVIRKSGIALSAALLAASIPSVFLKSRQEEEEC